MIFTYECMEIFFYVIHVGMKGHLVKIICIITGPKMKVKCINILDKSISKNSGQKVEVSRHLCLTHRRWQLGGGEVCTEFSIFQKLKAIEVIAIKLGWTNKLTYSYH